MPFRFTGSDTRTYTQYRDLDLDSPLIASPGGTYDMAPCGSYVLPVPPGDGNWAPVLASIPTVIPAPDPAAPIANDGKTTAKTASNTPATSADAPQGAV